MKTKIVWLCVVLMLCIGTGLSIAACMAAFMQDDSGGRQYSGQLSILGLGMLGVFHAGGLSFKKPRWKILRDHYGEAIKEIK